MGGQINPFHKKICESMKIPVPVSEWKFHPKRKWRFDFAWPDLKLAVELHGAIFSKYRSGHQASGHIRDMEKINSAVELGWKVLQYAPNTKLGVDYQQIKRVIDLTQSTF